MATIEYIGGAFDGMHEEIVGAIPPTIAKLQSVALDPSQIIDGVKVKCHTAVFRYTYTIHKHEGKIYGFKLTDTARTQ